jgi:hypothetical protein
MPGAAHWQEHYRTWTYSALAAERDRLLLMRDQPKDLDARMLAIRRYMAELEQSVAHAVRVTR